MRGATAAPGRAASAAPRSLGTYVRHWRRRKSVGRSEFLESDRRVRSDEYIPWLCAVLGGWVLPDHGNLRAFEYAVRSMPSGGAMVEVGSFLGLSTNLLAYLAMQHDRDNPFFSCDPWVFEGTAQRIGGYFDAGSEAFRHYAKRVFQMNVELFSGGRKPYAIETSSRDFFAQWDQRSSVQDVFGRSVVLGGPISFAYIDGAHTAEAVQGDFLCVDRHLLPGGFILFDDSDDGGCFPEVSQVARVVAEDPSYEVVFKTPHYFVRKMIERSVDYTELER